MPFQTIQCHHCRQQIRVRFPKTGFAPLVCEPCRKAHQKLPNLQRYPRPNDLKSVEADKCLICFEEDAQIIKAVLPCRHKFCLRCVTKLVHDHNIKETQHGRVGKQQERKSQCPLCRAEFTPIQIYQ